MSVRLSALEKGFSQVSLRGELRQIGRTDSQIHGKSFPRVV
jgi:hypothetical protein